MTALSGWEERICGLLERGPLTATEIELETTVNRKTLYGILSALQQYGYVVIQGYLPRGRGGGSGAARAVYALTESGKARTPTRIGR